MLSIEVNEVEQNGHTSYFHSVVVEGEITSDQAELLNDCIEVNADVTINLTRVRPGDDIYGTVADYHQFLFWAEYDMTGWINEMDAALAKGDRAFERYAEKFIGD